jgi:hypothetical protein
MPSGSPEGRLHLVLQPTSEEVYEPDFLLETPLIRFVAYDRSQRVFGWVSLVADRLTDLLNSCKELHLEEVETAGFEDRPARWADEVIIRRTDLIAVHASGPRGDEARRKKTRMHAVAMQSGNYLIAGHLHVAPGADPDESLRGRPAMVPLTDAWIEYWSGEERKHRATGTIIVNRDRTDWIRRITKRELAGGQLRPKTKG